jgi:hypothetical protein
VSSWRYARTLQPRHEWERGPVLPVRLRRGSVLQNGSQLSTCVHCHALRTRDIASGATHYTRREVEESARITTAEPPCLSPAAFFRAPW